MKVKFENNVLTVVTDITKEMVAAGISDLVARDEDNNALYKAQFKDVDGSIGTLGFTGNAYIENKLACVIIVKEGTTEAAVQKAYGEALLAARKYTAQIADEAAAKAADIASIFDAE